MIASGLLGVKPYYNARKRKMVFRCKIGALSPVGG